MKHFMTNEAFSWCLQSEYRLSHAELNDKMRRVLRFEVLLFVRGLLGFFGSTIASLKAAFETEISEKQLVGEMERSLSGFVEKVRDVLFLNRHVGFFSLLWLLTCSGTGNLGCYQGDNE